MQRVVDPLPDTRKKTPIQSFTEHYAVPSPNDRSFRLSRPLVY